MVKNFSYVTAYEISIICKLFVFALTLASPVFVPKANTHFGYKP